MAEWIQANAQALAADVSNATDEEAIELLTLDDPHDVDNTST